LDQKETKPIYELHERSRQIFKRDQSNPRAYFSQHSDQFIVSFLATNPQSNRKNVDPVSRLVRKQPSAPCAQLLRN